MFGSQSALSSNPFASAPTGVSSTTASPFAAAPKPSENTSSSNPFAKQAAGGSDKSFFAKEPSFDPWAQKEPSSLAWSSAAPQKRSSSDSVASDPWASWLKETPKKDDRDNSWGSKGKGKGKKKDAQNKWGENENQKKWGENWSTGWNKSSDTNWKGDQNWSKSWSKSWSGAWSNDAGNDKQAIANDGEPEKKVTLTARPAGNSEAPEQQSWDDFRRQWDDDGDWQPGISSVPEMKESKKKVAPPALSSALSIGSSPAREDEEEAEDEEWDEGEEEEGGWGEEGEEEEEHVDDAEEADSPDAPADVQDDSSSKPMTSRAAVPQQQHRVDVKEQPKNAIEIETSDEEQAEVEETLEVGGNTFTYAYDEDAITAAKNVRSFLAAPDSLGAPICNVEGNGVIGKLAVMCSEKEMKERCEQRQLDVLEWADGSTPQCPRLNESAACKKYQRSAADRVYHPEDIRTLPALAKCLFYLLADVISTDEKSDRVDYWQVYSFLRDRTRAVRVDLHLQQPWSTMTRVYIVAHEVCLRFEILSMYILTSKEAYMKKYDEKMAHKSCSQIIEPLLNAYEQVRSSRGSEGVYISPSEPAIRRYAILLLFVGGDESKVFEQLAKTPRNLLVHPAIQWAIEVTSSFSIGNYSRFLRLYLEADFLSAVILSPLTNLARQRLLWLLVRSSVPVRRDKLPLEDLRRRLAFWDTKITEQFLRFHGLEIIELGTGSNLVQLPSRTQGSWDVMHDGISQASFNRHLGTSALPMRCEFEKKHDGNLRAKYVALDSERSAIAFGAIDPYKGSTGMSPKVHPIPAPGTLDSTPPRPKAMPRLALASSTVESEARLTSSIAASPTCDRPLTAPGAEATLDKAKSPFLINTSSSEAKGGTKDKADNIFGISSKDRSTLVPKAIPFSSIFGDSSGAAVSLEVTTPSKKKRGEVEEQLGMFAPSKELQRQLSTQASVDLGVVPAASSRAASEKKIVDLDEQRSNIADAAVTLTKNPAVQSLFANAGGAAVASQLFADTKACAPESSGAKKMFVPFEQTSQQGLGLMPKLQGLEVHHEKAVPLAASEEQKVRRFRASRIFAAWYQVSRAAGGWTSWAKAMAQKRQRTTSPEGARRIVKSAGAPFYRVSSAVSESIHAKIGVATTERTSGLDLSPKLQGSELLHEKALSLAISRLRVSRIFAAWYQVVRATGGWTSWAKAMTQKRQRITSPEGARPLVKPASVFAAPRGHAASASVKRKDCTEGAREHDADRGACLLVIEAADKKLQRLRDKLPQKRSKSFLDVLKQDSEWTERLLRGVALLASDVPV